MTAALGHIGQDRGIGSSRRARDPVRRFPPSRLLSDLKILRSGWRRHWARDSSFQPIGRLGRAERSQGLRAAQPNPPCEPVMKMRAMSSLPPLPSLRVRSIRWRRTDDHGSGRLPSHELGVNQSDYLSRSAGHRSPLRIRFHAQNQWAGDLNSRPVDHQIGPPRLSPVNYCSRLSVVDR